MRISSYFYVNLRNINDKQYYLQAEGALSKVLRGSSASNSNPFFVTLRLTFATEKGTPFIYLLLTDGTPFAYLTNLERCKPYTCCVNAPSFTP